jgi:IPT/TIG domain
MRRWTWQAGLVLLCGLAGVLASDAQARAQGPVLTGISHNNGPAAGGTSLTLTGHEFIAGSTVRFGEAPAAGVHIDSPSSITATTPAGTGTVAVTVADPDGTSAATPKDQFAYDAPPSGPWLGLNGNSSNYLGPVDAFSKHEIVYDRSGPIDWIAGELLREDGRPTSDADALAADISNGMIPVITIEYRGYEGEYASDPRFPTAQRGSRTLQEYIEGFLSSASAILAAYPGRTILFEPMNEPWGYTKPQFNGAEYADVIARLLPAARLADLPLSSIYVAASGRHWISQMYKAQPSLQSEVQGWYFHPYGPASGSHGEDSQGIQSLPHVQREMTSGQNNIIVSEIGYCAEDVNHGSGCGGGGFAHGSEAAQALTETLDNAVPYHEAGWLRALLVYSRNDGGWAMQLHHGVLTAQGEALDAFADALKRPLHFLPFGSPQVASGPFEGRGGFAWLERLAP